MSIGLENLQGLIPILFLREAVDVIVIGEIRDLETAKQAIAYADGGSLCLSTMHSNNAHQAIERILNFFPSESHPQVLMDLSLNLRGVISQRLIPSKGKLVLATEVMMQSAFLSDIILNGRINELKDAMKKSTEEGMQIFDDSLFALYKAKAEKWLIEDSTNIPTSSRILSKTACFEGVFW